MRHYRFGVVLVALFVLGMSFGCARTEKEAQVNQGTAMGGGMGTIIGAGAGHASALGTGPGALVGLSLGSATGAFATDHYYDDPDAATLDPDLEDAYREKILNLERELEEAEQALAEREEPREPEPVDREMERDFGEHVQITRQEDGGYTATMLGDVLFESGRASLTDEGKSVLDGAAQQIRENFPDAYIEVRGHTDNVPITHSDWDSNWELSSARAGTVLHYLRDQHGFDPDRLRQAAYADTQPVASNETSEGRAQNRRAEIVIIPEGSEADRDRQW